MALKNNWSVSYQAGKTRISQVPAHLNWDGTRLTLTLDQTPGPDGKVFSVLPDEIRKIRASRLAVCIYLKDKYYPLIPRDKFKDFGSWLEDCLPPKLRFMKDVKITTVLMIVWLVVCAACFLAVTLAGQK